MTGRGPNHVERETDQGEPGGLSLELDRPLAILTPDQVQLIDKLLTSLGSFGEVRLVVREGHVSSISATESYDTRNMGE